MKKSTGFPIRQGFQPDAQGHACPLGGGLVPLPFTGRNPDVYTHAGGVFQGWPTPWAFGCGHGDIVDSQIILDKPPEWVFNVLTLNKESQMTKAISKTLEILDFLGMLAITLSPMTVFYVLWLAAHGVK